MSAMAQLTGQIEESTSDVIDYGLVSHSMMFSRNELQRARLSYLLSESKLLDAVCWRALRGEG